jgi:hypothetical protein
MKTIVRGQPRRRETNTPLIIAVVVSLTVLLSVGGSIFYIDYRHQQDVERQRQEDLSKKAAEALKQRKEAEDEATEKAANRINRMACFNFVEDEVESYLNSAPGVTKYNGGWTGPPATMNEATRIRTDGNARCERQYPY